MSHAIFPRGASDPAPTYSVVKMPDVDGVLGLFEVIKSYPPSAYSVMVTKDKVTCSCPDFYKWALDPRGPQMKDYMCKHIKMVAEKMVKK